MPTFRVSPELEMHYRVDDFTDPWTKPATMLLLHGNAESGAVWYGWVPHLARYYRVVRPDMRGHGQSDVPHERNELSIHRLVQDVLDFGATPFPVLEGQSGERQRLAAQLDKTRRPAARCQADTAAGADERRRIDLREVWLWKIVVETAPGLPPQTLLAFLAGLNFAINPMVSSQRRALSTSGRRPEGISRAHVCNPRARLTCR